MREPTRRELVRWANRLLRESGFYAGRNTRQQAFERTLISTPQGGQLRPGKFHRR